MKRFYEKVAIAQRVGGWQITLDERGIKTVRGAQQILPTEALARALAQEWDDVGERLDPGAFPFRDMADYAIDHVAGNRHEVAEKLLVFADTDTLVYRADPDEPLYARQLAVWEPILTAFERREDLAFKRVSGIMHSPQDAAIAQTLRTRLLALDPFVLAALEAITNLSASLAIGLSALEPEADAPFLWQAASLEEEWQADHWGREEEAEERRTRRAADFHRACEFARLANS